jgi:hypothetical protein
MKKFFLVILVLIALVTQSQAQLPTDARDSVGNDLRYNTPGYNIILDVKLYLAKYHTPTGMQNPWMPPKLRFEDYFGPMADQNKYWPYRGELSTYNTVDYIEPVYIELVKYGNNKEYFACPAYVHTSGQVLEFGSNRLPVITVRPGQHYELIVHLVSGTDPVALPVFESQPSIRYNFIQSGSRDNPFGLPNSQNNQNQVKQGDTWVWKLGYSNGISRDCIIDHTDVACIWNSRGQREGYWYPQDMNNDGAVNDADWTYIYDNPEVLFTMSAQWLPYFGVNKFMFQDRDGTSMYNVYTRRIQDTVEVYATATIQKKFWGLQVALDMTEPTLNTAPTGAWNYGSSPNATRFQVTPFTPNGVMTANVKFPNDSELTLSPTPVLIYKGIISPNGFNLFLPLCKLFIINEDGLAEDVSTQTEFNMQTTIGVTSDIIPDEFTLSQNYPNPFNPSTNIRFSIPQQSQVVLKIYDVLGKELMTLVNDVKTAGNYEVEFNASSFGSGTYFYKIQAGQFSDVKKMILTK